jgi:hypothetical protein
MCWRSTLYDPISSSDIEDDHLLNATYYSPEVEDQNFEGTALLGNLVHDHSPTHIETAGSVGKCLCSTYMCIGCLNSMVWAPYLLSNPPGRPGPGPAPPTSKSRPPPPPQKKRD